jgi:hypothetical protein
MRKTFLDNGFAIKKFTNSLVLKKLTRIVQKNFNKPDSFYINKSRKEFSKIAIKCQKQIDKSGILKIIYKHENNFFKKILNDDKIYYSSGGYLRAVRPSQKYSENEYLNWHRETFYGKKKFIQYGVNVWIPVMNVSNLNSLKYIPKSHKIKDNKIKRRKYKVINGSIKKNSNEHKLGYVYAPKKIISGVNLKKEKIFKFKKNQFVSFSSMLIHGNSKNFSNKIRFAFNFGVIGASKLSGSDKKIDSKNHKYLSFDDQ